MQVDLFQPPEGHPLRPYVMAIFRVRRGSELRETILPKGNVDFLFNLGDPLAVSGSEVRADRFAAAESRVGGVQTRPLTTAPGGGVHLLGVSLRMESCAAFMPLPLNEITDAVVEGPQLFPDLRDLCGRLADAPCFREQCALLTRWLLARLRPSPAAATVRHACALLRAAPADEAVRATAKALAVSPRHLRRIFHEQVGVSPREYVRVARFADALQALASPRAGLAEAALSAGYYDQAHFCHEFRVFAEMTPQEYRRAAAHAPGHILFP
jgi:AraC-like DNA-binding protein